MNQDIGDKLQESAQQVRDEANRARGRIEQAIDDARRDMDDDDEM